MTERVWVSLAPAIAEIIIGLESDIVRENENFAMDCVRRNERGEPLSEECFPKRINIDQNQDVPDALSEVGHLFHNAYWYVSGQCADVLLAHDLGEGAVYSVEFLKPDARSPAIGQYYSLNFGNTKETFVPQESKNVRENPYLKGRYRIYPIALDDDIVVTKAALAGADIWMDPSLGGCFFVSDRLAVALQAAGCDPAFQLRQCRIN